MAEAKALLCKNKELSVKWGAICSSDWFREILLYCQYELVSSPITEQELVGAKRFQRVLLTITDSDDVPHETMKCPVNHDVDNILSSARQPETKKESKS